MFKRLLNPNDGPSGPRMPMPSPALTAGAGLLSPNATGNGSFSYFPTMQPGTPPRGTSPLPSGHLGLVGMTVPAPVSPAMVDRASMHRSLTALETLLQALAEHRDYEVKLAAANKTLAKAARDFASSLLETTAKDRENIPAGALKACASLFEAVGEVGSKVVKANVTSFDAVNDAAGKAFKDIAKMERKEHEASDELEAKIRKADATFVKQLRAYGPAVSVTPVNIGQRRMSASHAQQMTLSLADQREAAAIQAKRVASIAQIAGELEVHKTTYATKMATRRETLALEAARAVAGLAQAEWKRVFESTKKAGNEIGCVGAWHALLECPMGVVAPSNLPDSPIATSTPPLPSTGSRPPSQQQQHIIRTRRVESTEDEQIISPSSLENTSGHSSSEDGGKKGDASGSPVSALPKLARPTLERMHRGESAPVLPGPRSPERERERARASSPTQNTRMLLDDLGTRAEAVIVLSRNPSSGELEKYEVTPRKSTAVAGAVKPPNGFVVDEAFSPDHEKPLTKTRIPSPVRTTSQQQVEKLLDEINTSNADDSRDSHVAKMSRRYVDEHGRDGREPADSPRDSTRPSTSRRVSDLARRFNPDQSIDQSPPLLRNTAQHRVVSSASAHPHLRSLKVKVEQTGDREDGGNDATPRKKQSYDDSIIHSDVCGCHICSARHYRDARHASLPVVSSGRR